MTSLERSDDCRGRHGVWASDLNKISFGLGILNMAVAVMNELSEEGGSVVVVKPAVETTPSTFACSRWPGAALAYLILSLYVKRSWSSVRPSCPEAAHDAVHQC